MAVARALMRGLIVDALLVGLGVDSRRNGALQLARGRGTPQRADLAGRGSGAAAPGRWRADVRRDRTPQRPGGRLVSVAAGAGAGERHGTELVARPGQPNRRGDGLAGAGAGAAGVGAAAVVVRPGALPSIPLGLTKKNHPGSLDPGWFAQRWIGEC